MKDNFSMQSDLYVKFRPSYPRELFHFIYELVPVKGTAWDCATGNGQVAKILSNEFEEVFATDISEAQLSNAFIADNITYLNEPAESTSFQNNSFDLITVGQAIHWFEFEKFYDEARRTIKPGGIVAAIGYDNLRCTPAVNKVICTFYNYILGIYWDKERKYIDEQYKTIPFPFEEIQAPYFPNTYNWTFEQLTGYLNTWSAVQHFIKVNGYNPLELVLDDLKEAWGPVENQKIEFPIISRIGRCNK